MQEAYRIESDGTSDSKVVAFFYQFVFSWVPNKTGDLNNRVDREFPRYVIRGGALINGGMKNQKISHL